MKRLVLRSLCEPRKRYASHEEQTSHEELSRQTVSPGLTLLATWKK